MRSRRAIAGQGVLEYILVLTMILVALLATAGLMKGAVKDKALKTAEDQIKVAGDKFVVK